MQSFINEDGHILVKNLIQVIHENKEYLSEVDGAIGDGDHGINMDKGFSKTLVAMNGRDQSLTESFNTLSDELMIGIGGSMGPLYGTFFKEMADVSEGHILIDETVFGMMLDAGLQGIQDIGGAKLGDKTLLDTLIPAVNAFHEAIALGKDFSDALKAMDKAAETGKETTRDLIAKIGRAARLGERSRGTLDAGATSCNLILHSMVNSILSLLNS